MGKITWCGRSLKNAALSPTSAAVPYCDPRLTWNRGQIKEDRKRRQAKFQGPSSNQWRKRWLKR